ncbi:acetoacetyl-CoA synthase [Patellaria atrata CBS 101060]|uniref:Acetoacetyl-CoA synthase n=1 Tax=Patellaria atrata CBS 101060 TaxID=1346257 RepID=A0A9P4SF25_9PEZI|nr:acetoacetyl-CoA synthase [Patellaria atrata CBS 101060]
MGDAYGLHTPRKIWEHPNPKGTSMWKFIESVNRRRGLNLKGYRDLYAWSVGDNRVDFWNDVWKGVVGLIYEGSYDQVVDPNARMDSIPHWFRGVRLNFAENILYSQSSPSDPSTRSTAGKEDSKIVLTAVREGGEFLRQVTWGELRRRVGILANALKARGVRKGDRVAIVASNSVDTLCVFMATTALGGLFTSSSTDMGTKGVLDRLLQIRPKFVFVDDWAVYNGKTTDLRKKVAGIARGLKDVEEFQGMVVQPRFDKAADIAMVPRAETLEKFVEAAGGKNKIPFERVEFRDPFLVVYSSGTTGTPKCIVHSTGGVLLSSKKEGILHKDLGPDTVAMQFTTTGWIMYMASIVTLLHGARVVMYDGSPFYPDLKFFISLAAQQKVTIFGISPRYLHELQKNNISPREICNLSSFRTVTSTGMVLSDALFEWFYDTGFPKHVQLANISGGTDIAGCFGMENPLEPVYVGGTMGPSLGIKVEVYDQMIEGGKGVKGRAVEDGVPGELVA